MNPIRPPTFLSLHRMNVEEPKAAEPVKILSETSKNILKNQMDSTINSFIKIFSNTDESSIRNRICIQLEGSFHMVAATQFPIAPRLTRSIDPPPPQGYKIIRLIMKLLIIVSLLYLNEKGK
jgi:hypothetical protein